MQKGVIKNLKINIKELTTNQKRILYDYFIIVSAGKFTIENENITAVLDDIVALFYDEKFDEQ